MRIVYTLLFLTVCLTSYAQSPFAGSWSGKLQVGVTMRLVFHVKDSVGLHATMDSPDQNAFGFKADEAIVRGDSITILFNRIRGKYMALLQTINDKQQLNGKWYQSGMQFPLVMDRGEAPAPLRPQTPKAPFNYVVEDVVYTNADKSVTLGATLTKPNGSGKFPVLILITGSGQQDRDETLMSHKPFWVIADHLTKNGFAVLRVDDRGMGESRGEIWNATSDDFANDVITSMNYLKTRNDIDLKKIGLLGHSEGGLIAPIVATKTKDVAFMVLLAGPSVKGAEVLDEQRSAIMKSNGISEPVVDEIEILSRKTTNIIITAKTKEEAQATITEIIKLWMPKASSDAKEALTVTSEKQADAYANQVVSRMYVPWFRYFLQFDPAPVLVKSKCPVLAVYGSKDIQVIPSQNVEPMKQALSKSRKAKDFSIVELEGLNHLFQKCNTCTLAEYGELTQTFSEDALTVITDWLKQTVSKK